MIHVELQQEPNNFETLVRSPGNAFLKGTPNPTEAQWRSHSFWRRVLTDLRHLYGGICAYSCHWIPPDTGGKTVEHFVPKAVAPALAYEWTNYRLVCSLLNSRKKTRVDTLDPFEVENGWFVIDFPSLLVKPAPHLDEPLAAQVRSTIAILGLNDEESCLENRARFVEEFCRHGAPFNYIERNAPFLALEISRQNLRNTLKDIMIYE